VPPRGARRHVPSRTGSDTAAARGGQPSVPCAASIASGHRRRQLHLKQQGHVVGAHSSRYSAPSQGQVSGMCMPVLSGERVVCLADEANGQHRPAAAGAAGSAQPAGHSPSTTSGTAGAAGEPAQSGWDRSSSPDRGTSTGTSASSPLSTLLNPALTRAYDQSTTGACQVTYQCWPLLVSVRASVTLRADVGTTSTRDAYHGRMKGICSFTPMSNR